VLFNSHALSQLKLSKLNDGMFPIPQYSNVPKKTLDTCKYKGKTHMFRSSWTNWFLLVTSLNVRCSPMENLLHFDLEPKPVLRKLEHVPFDHSYPNSPACKEVEALTEYIADAAEAKLAITELPTAEEVLGGEVEITTLGTGSSLPSKYRNGKILLRMTT
jgi:ribonuclease Z